jgi:hypothetical protein
MTDKCCLFVYLLVGRWVGGVGGTVGWWVVGPVGLGR